MTRHEIIERIGSQYHTSNIEGGEYSYIKEAGSRNNLKKMLGRDFSHFKLDIRFEAGNVVVLVETKQNFVDIVELQDRIQSLEDKLQDKEDIIKSKETEILALRERTNSIISKYSKQKSNPFERLANW